MSAEVDEEVWRPVPEWEGHYEVSNHGRMKSVARLTDSRWGPATRPIGEMLLTQNAHPRTGHLRVRLQTGQRGFLGLVHRLVLRAFVGEPPPGLICCHNDGDPSNNHLSNLRWDTRSANGYDSVLHGTHYLAIRTHCKAGHPYDASNTYREPGKNKRACRACRREAEARRRAERSRATA